MSVAVPRSPRRGGPGGGLSSSQPPSIKTKNHQTQWHLWGPKALPPASVPRPAARDTAPRQVASPGCGQAAGCWPGRPTTAGRTPGGKQGPRRMPGLGGRGPSRSMAPASETRQAIFLRAPFISSGDSTTEELLLASQQHPRPSWVLALSSSDHGRVAARGRAQSSGLQILCWELGTPSRRRSVRLCGAKAPQYLGAPQAPRAPRPRFCLPRTTPDLDVASVSSPCHRDANMTTPVVEEG